MSTIIYPSPIFGPVHSRRLGISLGINLMPADGKVCTFDCIYCECGFNKQQLFAEYQGYTALKPFKTGEIYGCQVDKTPYFEEVSWRPDWLLSDLIQLFHPDLRSGSMRYYHRL